MRCGACRKPIRQDEGLATCYCDGTGGPGYYQACPRCCARAEGGHPPEPKRYLAQDIYDPRGLNFETCGLCREAMFWGERASVVRLTAGDIDEGLTDYRPAEGIIPVAPGVYHMCPRCAGYWRPLVAARWVREGVITSALEVPEPLV